MRVKLNLDPPRPPLPTPLTNQSLDQKQTLRPLRRSECLKKKRQSLQRRRLLQNPTCHSLLITLGRTSLLLMSLQTLRAPNYIWILSWIQHSPTLHTLLSQREDDTGGLFHRDAPKPTAPTLTGRSPMETSNQFQIFLWSLKIWAGYRNSTANTSVNLREATEEFLLWKCVCVYALCTYRHLLLECVAEALATCGLHLILLACECVFLNQRWSDFYANVPFTFWGVTALYWAKTEVHYSSLNKRILCL